MTKPEIASLVRGEVAQGEGALAQAGDQVAFLQGFLHFGRLILPLLEGPDVDPNVEAVSSDPAVAL